MTSATVISEATPSADSGDQGLWLSMQQHVSELRSRLIISVVAFVVATLGTFFVSQPIIAVLQHLVPEGTLFVQLSPGEVFLSSFRLSVFVGLGLSLPITLYHAIRFVSPGLTEKERRYTLPVLALGLLLFVAGVGFGYKVVLPLMLNFLLHYGQDVAVNQLSIAKFLDFCSGFLFTCGLVFQLPLLLLLLSLLGLITSHTLLQQWRVAIVASFLLGAIVTPSADPFSQSVLAVSLFGLYGLSIGLIKLAGR